MLRLLTGYLHPSSGTARIAGFDVVEAGLAARRCVGYVPEDVPLYSHMRVDEFLPLWAASKGLLGVRCATGWRRYASVCIFPRCGLRPLVSCRAGIANEWPLLRRCSTIRLCSSWTNPPMGLTHARSSRCVN